MHKLDCNTNSYVKEWRSGSVNEVFFKYQDPYGCANAWVSNCCTCYRGF